MAPGLRDCVPWITYPHTLAARQAAKSESQEAEIRRAHRYAPFVAGAHPSTRPTRGDLYQEERHREKVRLLFLAPRVKKHFDNASNDPQRLVNEHHASTFHFAAIDSRQSRPSIGGRLAARATNFRSEYPGAACNHRTTRQGPDRSGQLLHLAARAAKRSTSERSTMSQ